MHGWKQAATEVEQANLARKRAHLDAGMMRREAEKQRRQTITTGMLGP
jgi:hypothetical protein